MQGSTAMMHAAWNGQTDTVKYLLSAGGDVAARDNQVSLSFCHKRRQLPSMMLHLQLAQSQSQLVITRLTELLPMAELSGLDCSTYTLSVPG